MSMADGRNWSFTFITIFIIQSNLFIRVVPQTEDFEITFDAITCNRSCSYPNLYTYMPDEAVLDVHF